LNQIFVGIHVVLAKKVGDRSPISVAKPLPKEIDVTGRRTGFLYFGD
jgi:hypothetical protein